MTDLAAACTELARLLPAAAALLAQPDEDGTTGTGQPGTRPPWNSAAANALMDAHEGTRRLEASMRRDVTGHTGRRRGGSDAGTMAAIAAIGRLAHAVDDDAQATAAAILERWARRIRELPAIDESEPWRRLHGVACPYCRVAMLRIQPRAGTVTCLRHGACYDTNDQHPMGRVYVSQIDAVPRVAWNDGLVT